MKRHHIAAGLAGVVLTLASCGSDDANNESGADTSASPMTSETVVATSAPADTETTDTTETTETTAPDPGAVAACGLGTGEQATGEPIKIGSMTTQIPGIDLSASVGGLGAYFDCVNANGGVNGRPIELIVENDQLDPGKAAAAGRKLVESDGVVLVGGGISLLDCALNGTYYGEQGLNVILGGVGAACFGLSNISPINGGPAYAGLLNAQSVVAQGATGKIVMVAPTVPGVEYFASAAQAYAEQNGLEFEAIFPEAPIQDGASVMLDAVNRAGDGGGIVISGAAQDTATMLQGASDQGLIDRVFWSAGAAANDASLAEALGDEWNGKITIASELTDPSVDHPDISLYLDTLAEFSPETSVGSFSQMGFLSGQIMVDAMLGIDGEVTRASANEAIRQITSYDTGLLCKPWYFGDSDLHLAVNTMALVVPDGDVLVPNGEGCIELEPVDALIVGARDYEAANGLG